MCSRVCTYSVLRSSSARFDEWREGGREREREGGRVSAFWDSALIYLTLVLCVCACACITLQYDIYALVQLPFLTLCI